MDAARNGIKTGGSQHVDIIIPTDVLERVEFVGDAWNGRCNNISIQCDKKNRQIHANDNRPLEGLWLEILFGIFIFVDCLDWQSPLGWGTSLAEWTEAVEDIINPGRTSAVSD